MNNIIAVNKKDDIFPIYKNTPIGLLLEYHNLKKAKHDYENAQLLIGMCMDHRKKLNLPENFAYIMRSGGGNLRFSEFKISYSIAIGGIESIALIAHNYCGMVNLISKKEQFIEGLVKNAGWDAQLAEDHFMNFAPLFEIGNEIDFVIREAKRLKIRYPRIEVAPLFYNVEDNLLYQIEM